MPGVRKFRPIKDTVVAKVMINSTKRQSIDEIIESKDVFKMTNGNLLVKA